MSDINGNYDDFLGFMESMVASIIPNHTDKYEVYGDENQKRLKIVIEFSDDEPIGLLFGYGKQYLKALLTFARAQQIYSHDRFVWLVVKKSDGTEQSFINKNCAAIRRYDAEQKDDNGKPKYTSNELRRRALARSFKVLSEPFDQ